MKTYSGSCHCGGIRYEVSMELDKAMECNCSHCQAKGLLLTFVPAEQFTLKTPAAPMSEYRFNTKEIQHIFCPSCGVEPFGRGVRQDGTKMVSVNVRTLHDIDLQDIERYPFDGRGR